MDIIISIFAAILLIIYFSLSIYGLHLMVSKKFLRKERLKWGAIIYFLPIIGFILFYFDQKGSNVRKNVSIK